MLEFFVMLCVVAWGIILTIGYVINTSFQNRRIKDLENKFHSLTLKCKLHGQRQEDKTNETEGAKTGPET